MAFKRNSDKKARKSKAKKKKALKKQLLMKRFKERLAASDEQTRPSDTEPRYKEKQAGSDEQPRPSDTEPDTEAIIIRPQRRMFYRVSSDRTLDIQQEVLQMEDIFDFLIFYLEVVFLLSLGYLIKRLDFSRVVVEDLSFVLHDDLASGAGNTD